MERANFLKISNLCAKRALAADPGRAEAFYIKLVDHYDKLVVTGKMDRYPTSIDQYNADEVAVDARGPAEQQFGCKEGDLGMGQEFGMHPSRVVGTEKSPFHITMVLTTRADGDLDVPPLVIHKSDRADFICANLFSNLPVDWCMATSPSAYMTRQIMVQWIKHFIARSGASLTSPKVLFLDGHDSHVPPSVVDIQAPFRSPRHRMTGRGPCGAGRT